MNPNSSSTPEGSGRNSPEVEVDTAFKTGQIAFERGLYREAISWFEQALTLTSAQSALGGSIQTWLVTAYDAAGQNDAALFLCRQLSTHPHLEIRQQNKRLLFILEAPKLQARTEWLTQIPDLNQPAATRRYNAAGQSGSASQPKTPEPKSITEVPFEPIEPKESRGFLGIALGMSCIILLGLWWLSQGSV